MSLSRALTLPFVLSLLYPLSLGAIGPTADLEIVNVDVSPDGFTRAAISAGGGVTGPLIVADKGETLSINVIDSLTDDTMLEPTSIHWHGFFQQGTNYEDGVAFVNQCPIIAGDSYNYEFSTTDQAGTFWYHSHLSTQYCDGLRGPLVVYDPNDPHASLYDVDDETTVWTLQDWYHAPAPSLTLPTPDAALFNGLGRYDGGNATALSVNTVTQGTKYRIRLASLSCDPNYTFKIDGHTFTVIEVDAVNVVPFEVDEIQIFAGQRYSFILEANQPVDNYWIRFLPNLGTQGYDGGLNSAILRYDGADEVDPTTSEDTASSPLVETDLIPLENPGAPGTPGVGNADININLEFGFAGTFTVNGATYESPTLPVLLQLLSGEYTADELMPEGSVYHLEKDSVVELSMPAGVAGGPHPFHLHGHTFDVVRSAGQTDYNYDNPPKRDVVSIGAAGDNVTIRWRTDNPGPWFLHCHIDWHLEIGLAVVFAEATDDWATANAVTPEWEDLCPAYEDSVSRRRRSIDAN